MVSIICQRCQISTEVANTRFRYCCDCSKQLCRERCKKYKHNHKEDMQKYNTQYKKEHELKLKVQQKQYYDTHKHIIREKVRGYHKKYFAKYPQAKMFHAMRGRLNHLLKSKRPQFNNSKELIGCSKLMLLAWIEFQFNANQTFANHGTVWHLDHCIPCTKFDIKKPEDISKCFHWSNLQPMDARRNLLKNNKTSLMEQLMQELKICVFLKQHKKYKNYTVLKFDRSVYV